MRQKLKNTTLEKPVSFSSIKSGQMNGELCTVIESQENKVSSCCQLCGSVIMKTNCEDLLGSLEGWSTCVQTQRNKKKKARRKTIQRRNSKSYSAPPAIIHWITNHIGRHFVSWILIHTTCPISVLWQLTLCFSFSQACTWGTDTLHKYIQEGWNFKCTMPASSGLTVN